MGGHRLRLPAAVVILGLAAGAATFLLRPRGGLIEPSPVEKTAYFSPAEIERAEGYRRPQRVLFLGGLVVSGATLALVALRPSRRMRRALERAAVRPLAGGAGVGAALSLTLVAVTLPLDAISHQRAVDVGLSTQTWGPWLGDVAKASGLNALFAAGGGAAAVALAQRFPRHWWLPGAAAVAAVSAVFVFLSPIVLDPIFNRFTPLPHGRLRTEVLELAERSGVQVGEVFRMDASRRTTGANAYVGGLGGTKRVVLYDNLLEDFAPAEVRSVVAHELAHQKHRDLHRGLLWLALVSPPAGYLAQQLTQRFLSMRPRARSRPGERLAGTPAMLPALALSLALVSFVVTAAGNTLSRRVEARADGFALELTRDAQAFIGLERRLAVRNVSDPDPPPVLHLMFGTHPTTLERIGYGVTWARRNNGG